MRTDFEVIIVGSGIAGASLAYFLSERGMTDVLLLEREEHPGYHSTGRSAATVVEWDSVPEVRELKIQGAEWLRQPPDGFSEHRLLDPAGILVTAQEPFWSTLRAMGPLIEERGTAVRLMSRAEVVERFPVLSPDHLDGGLFLCEDGHLDVHELLWSYLRHAGRRGVQRRCGVEVRGVRVERGRVRGLETTAGMLTAR